MEHLTAREIRARLSGTRPARDPGQVDIAAATRGWRPGFRERLVDRLVPAAVLVAFPLEFRFAGQRIWGVTASILFALREVLCRER